MSLRLLVSVESIDEARVVVRNAGCEILDIKNVAEGALGANFPWVVKAIMEEFQATRLLTSATIGTFPFIPGSAALAAYGASSLGLDYIKVGVTASTTFEQAVQMMRAVHRAVTFANPNAQTVAAGFADWRRLGGLSSADVVRAATDSQVDVVLIDTAVKDGSSLFDHMSLLELHDFVGACHAAGMKCALAGSVQEKHLDELARIGPDWVGVRGAICSDQLDRRSTLDAVRLDAFVAASEDATRRTHSAT